MNKRRFHIEHLSKDVAEQREGKKAEELDERPDKKTHIRSRKKEIPSHAKSSTE